MHRFYIPSEAISGDSITFSKNQSHQIINVLRMAPGNSLVVFDGQGGEFEVGLSNMQVGPLIGKIIKNLPSHDVMKIAISLFISPIKQDHFEYVLQKSTEIGVRSITPVISSRTIINLPDWNKKIERWRRIIIEAAEQSRCSRLPELHEPVNFQNAFLSTNSLDRCYIAWENEQSQNLVTHILKDPYPCPRKVGLCIGPEGGYSATEITRAKEAKFIPVSLGSQILRSETAAIVGTSLLINLLTYLWSSRN